jgi:uncharacterized protein (TIGR03435 family)
MRGGWIVSVFCQAVACLFLAFPAVAQSQAFATITVRSARSADPRNMRMQVLPNGDLIANAVPVIRLLSYAYDVPVNPSPRLSSLPDWVFRERYDIDAKAPANAISPGIQGSEARSRAQQMIRGLLADRFGLLVRVENKTMAIYALSVASGGPKLQKSAITEKDCTFDTDPEGCHNFVGGLGHPLNARAIDTDDVAHYISNWTDFAGCESYGAQWAVRGKYGGVGSYAAATSSAEHHSDREPLRWSSDNLHGVGETWSRTAETRGCLAGVHGGADRASGFQLTISFSDGAFGVICVAFAGWHGCGCERECPGLRPPSFWLAFSQGLSPALNPKDEYRAGSSPCA